MRTLIITGVNGFVGQHLARVATGEGWRVWGVGQGDAPAPMVSPNLDEYFSRDLSKAWDIPTGAHAIVHLAGLSAVAPSFADPQRYVATNSAVMTTMCESLRGEKRPARIIVVSSGAVYSSPRAGTPITENGPTAPSSPYVMSKLLVEMQAQYYRTRGLDTVVTRPFNHIGPGQNGGFIVPDLFASVERLTDGEPLVAGDLTSRRDYTDVRDVVDAYIRLASAARPSRDVYNIASGISMSGADILKAVCHALNREVPRAETASDRLRPNDARNIVGDATLLREEFGWQPKIAPEASILDYAESQKQRTTIEFPERTAIK